MSKSKIISLMVLLISLFSFSAACQAEVKVKIGKESNAISNDLFGIFFEDINDAADGGLYAELVQNRSFEYSQGDNKNWNSLSYWQKIESSEGSVEFAADTAMPLNENNPTYAVVTVNKAGDKNGIVNEGFDGIVLKENDKYNLSLFAKVLGGIPGEITVNLKSEDGSIAGTAKISGVNNSWKKYTADIQSKQNIAKGKIEILIEGTGKVAFDMISLFPEKTFKNRKNGLRADLAQVIADLKPKFIRFPGGCLAHGDGLENMYRWKDTIGPIEERKAQRNIWRYHQTTGLGYFEYFQFCEDIGAAPLPVVPAGVCCQNSGHYLNLAPKGQQGLPLDEMDDYVQEVLDLIEYANGPVSSEWGSKRAAAGHPEPFNLKYLGVGNEDVISETFRVRYKMINDAIKAKYPEIIVIGTTGPFTDGEDYDEGWKFAREEKLEMVDEHGYKSPSWFWQNLERFDKYDHNGTKVYLGEYAAHEGNRANTLRSALAEAAYMTTLERNGDLVWLSSYAPLLSKIGRTQWTPDMIYFNNEQITLTTNYYAQQMFSANNGDEYLQTELTVPDNKNEIEASQTNGVVLASWNTQVQYDDLTVTSNGKTFFEEDFSSDTANWKNIAGNWKVSDGKMEQTSGATPALSMEFFNCPRKDYTVSVRAKKLSGAEGFLVGFGAKDENNYYWLNLGGWGNTAHRVQKTTEGSGTSVGPEVKGSIEDNKWYDVKIVVSDKNIKCYLDGDLVIDMNDDGFIPTPDYAVSTVRDSKSNEIIIKLVSKSDSDTSAAINLSDFGKFSATAEITVLTGDKMAVNQFGKTPMVTPAVSLRTVSEKFSYIMPSYSLTVIRLKDIHRIFPDQLTEADMSAYLLTYFKDPTHSLYMALSSDGYSFTDVNNGEPVINGREVAEQKGIRDPHITRGPDNKFYLAMTDLHIFAQKEGLRDTEWQRDGRAYGWGNNQGFVLMKSDNLINWSTANLRVDQAFEGLEDIGCAWAPETIYDPKDGRMMLYFTMRFGNGVNRLYYSYMNDDYTKMETRPELLFTYPKDITYIDADITKVGNKYHMFYTPHDGTPGIKQAISDKINTDYIYDPKFYDYEKGSCEAPNVWKRIGEDKWVLMYDIYSIKPHNFGFAETSDFVNFKNLGHFNEGVMKATNFSSPKHAAVIHLTKAEADKLAKHWGCEKY